MWGEDLPDVDNRKKDVFGNLLEQWHKDSPYEDQRAVQADALAVQRQKAMDAAARMDAASKGQAFKKSPAGTQLNPRGAGQFGGGMEGMASPVLQGGMGLVARKQHFPRAVREGLASPGFLEAKRALPGALPKNLQQGIVQHKGQAQDQLGAPVDFWENVPGWEARTPRQAEGPTQFGQQLAGAANVAGKRVGDLHHQNVLKLPGGKHKAVDFVAVDDLKGRENRWPWQHPMAMEIARHKQKREDPALMMARRFDSPEAAKQKQERGGYAEDPYKRVERLKKQRAGVQKQEQSPKAREIMQQLNVAQQERQKHLALPEGQRNPTELAKLDKALQWRKQQMADIRGGKRPDMGDPNAAPGRLANAFAGLKERFKAPEVPAAPAPLPGKGTAPARPANVPQLPLMQRLRQAIPTKLPNVGPRWKQFMPPRPMRMF